MLESVFKSIKNYVDSFYVCVVSHDSNSPNLPCCRTQTTSYLHTVLYHAVIHHSLPINPLGHLDGVDGGQPARGVLHEHFQLQLSQAFVKTTSANPVSPPQILQSLLGSNGQPFSQ